jgi:hypothetical protein
VRDVVKRFRVGEEDADASILLPKETVSPGKGKGKARGDERVPMGVSQLSSRDKGKQLTREVDDCEYEFVHTAETSGEVRVRGKERELVEAREEHLRKERRRERDREKDVEEAEKERNMDKERIKMLEQEIQRLKEEVYDFFYCRVAF